MQRLLALFNLVLKLRDRLHECCVGSVKTRQACLNITPDGCVVTQVVLVGPIAGYGLVCVWHNVEQSNAKLEKIFRILK